MAELSREDRRRKARADGERSSLEFLLDILSLDPPRSHTREGIVVKGENVPDIPGHVFQFLGVIFIALLIIIATGMLALGGLVYFS